MAQSFTAFDDLLTNIREGQGDHDKLHNATNTALNLVKSALLANGLFLPPSVILVPGTDLRTQLDYATGIPVKPAGVTAITTPRTLLSDDASSDGIIHVPKGWYVKDGGNPFEPFFQTNCGATPIDWSEAVVITPQGFALGSGNDVNIKIRDVSIYATDKTADGNTVRPRGIVLNQPKNVDIAYVTGESWGGIYIDHWNGDNSANQQIKISNIKSRNIIGTNGGNGSGDYRSVVQINGARTPGYLKFIESINEPDKSRVEDTINLYDAGGPDENTLFTLDGLFLNGGWPIGATSTQYTGALMSFDGTGGDASKPGTSNTRTTNLFCTSAGNAACNIAIGRNNIVDGLTAVSCGYFADGTPSYSTYSGCAVIDYYNTGTVLGNYIRNAKLAWIRTKDTPSAQRVRLDVAPSSLSGAVVNPLSITGDITLETERQVFLQWINYLNSNGQTVGSRARF